MNKEIWKKPGISSNIGGSALIEGVMMRGNNQLAMSVRKSSGEIYTETKPSIPIQKKYKIAGFPFIRGAVSMIDSMVVSMKVLMDSAEYVDFSDDEDEKESKFDLWIQKILGEKYMSYLLYSSVAIAILLGIGLFMLLPNIAADFLTDLLKVDKDIGSGAFVASLTEGLLRVLIFLLYIVLISRNKDIKRVFQYHGAEHKAIHAYENREELTVENVRKHTTLHPRCGTTFLFVVIILSTLIFAFTGWHNKLVNLLIRLILIPVISGVSYEVFKLAARTDNKLVRAISYPGLMLQKITTREPDDSMIEVAIASLKAVLDPESVKTAQEKVNEETTTKAALEVSDTEDQSTVESGSI